MAWWRRTRKTEDAVPSSPPPARPETDAERILRWRRIFAEQDRRKALERARQAKWDAEEQARRDEAQREWIAQGIARNGVYFPGDELDQVRPGFEQIAGDDPATSGGDNGPFYGLFRWRR